MLSLAFTLVLVMEHPPIERLEIIRPPPLQRGDTIGLVAPASPLTAALVRSASENLSRRGYVVRIAQNPRDKRGYLAGDDERRSEALNAMIGDPEVKAIICLRGGYGSPRILERVDYGLLRTRPKIVVGYSDITALLIAIHQRTGLVTFHGPMGKEWSTGKGISPFSEKYYWDLLTTPPSPLLPDWGGKRFPGMKEPIALVEGSAEGRLVGGNLSVICSTMGTPFELNARDAILFLEDVAEKPFRIDRMLNQLRLAGKLREARGILLGVFAACDTGDRDGSLSLAEVFSDYFVPLGVPVLYEYPAGHVPDQVLLPIGSRVRLDATARTLSILESPVEEASAATPLPRDSSR